MNWLLLQSLLLPVIWIQALYAALHYAFVAGKISTKRPFKMWILRFAFGLELIPMYVCALLTDPLPLAAFTVLTWIHLIIHSAQAFQVVVLNQDPDLHIPIPFWGEVPARMYVFFDAAIHTSNMYRLSLLSHYYVIGSAVAFAISFIVAVNDDDIRRDNVESECPHVKAN